MVKGISWIQSSFDDGIASESFASSSLSNGFKFIKAAKMITTAAIKHGKTANVDISNLSIVSFPGGVIALRKRR